MGKNFEKVKRYYAKGYWSLKWVWDAVGLWITADEFLDITGKEYEKE